jgi:hypothetical protein
VAPDSELLCDSLAPHAIVNAASPRAQMVFITSPCAVSVQAPCHTTRRGAVFAWIVGVKILVFVLAGALLGIAIASLVVPPALAWYTAPGGLPQGAQIQALVQIPEVIRYSTGRLMRGQLIGAGIGAVVGFGIGFFVSAGSRRRVVHAA